jgi:hypothetical protein
MSAMRCVSNKRNVRAHRFRMTTRAAAWAPKRTKKACLRGRASPLRRIAWQGPARRSSPDGCSAAPRRAISVRLAVCRPTRPASAPIRAPRRARSTSTTRACSLRAMVDPDAKRGFRGRRRVGTSRALCRKRRECSQARLCHLGSSGHTRVVRGAGPATTFPADAGGKLKPFAIEPFRGTPDA